VLAALGKGALRVSLVILTLLLIARWSGLPEGLFFHPAATTFQTPPEFEDVWFTTRDGKKLHAWYMPPLGRHPGDPPSPAVLHCHGNEGDVEAHRSTSEYLRAAGIGVLLFDYRGFGRSEPDRWITRRNLMDDTRAAYDALAARPDVDKARVGVFGYSLGGAFGTAIALEHPEVRCVCTVATFANWPGVASDFVPVLGHALIQTGMAVEDGAAALGRRPLLVVHGDRDSIVPFRHAERIAAAARAAGVDVTFLPQPGRGHLNIFTPGVKAAITAFFVKHLAPEAPAQPTSPAPTETH
jgi:dipeptidyl aminopeptidase/acylaminoacyl peptidase